MAIALNRKNQRLIFETAFFVIIAVFLFWRCRYGYYGSDENFMFGLAQRLYYGQSLLTDEWHLCQHAGLFFYPFYILYYSIFNTVEGLSIFFRYIFCIIYIVTLIYINYKLSNLKPYTYPAILCAALYTPLDHMTLSYTSLSFIFVLVLSVKIYKDVLLDKRSDISTGVTLGLLYTALTLAYPYFAIPAFLYFSAIFFLFIFRNKNNRYDYIFKLSFYAALSIGICVAVYCVLLFTRTDINSIVQNFPELFKDPQHPSRAFLFTVYDAIYTTMMTGKETLASGVVYYGTAMLLIGLSFSSEKFRKFRPFIMLFIFMLWLYNEWDIFIETYPKLNRQMKDIFVVGILAFALLNKKPWKLFLSFYLMSGIYLIITWFSSNTGLHVLSMGYSLGSICALILIALLAGEIHEEYRGFGWKRFAAISAAVLLLFGQTALEVRVRYDRTYHDKGLPEMKYLIEDGPSKGVYTSKKYYDEYYGEYNSIKYLLGERNTEGKTFLALNSTPLVYLVADMPCSSYSTWMLGDGNAAERVKRYLEINNLSSPDYIYDHLGTEEISKITDAEYEVINYNNSKLYIKNPVS